MPVLKDLPDGGTVTFIGAGFHSWYEPCSWTLMFTAPPPMSLVSELLAVAPGFGYGQGPQTPARPPLRVFSDSPELQSDGSYGRPRGRPFDPLAVLAPERPDAVGGRVTLMRHPAGLELGWALSAGAAWVAMQPILKTGAR